MLYHKTTPLIPYLLKLVIPQKGPKYLKTTGLPQLTGSVPVWDIIHTRRKALVTVDWHVESAQKTKLALAVRQAAATFMVRVKITTVAVKKVFQAALSANNLLVRVVCLTNCAFVPLPALLKNMARMNLCGVL
jgi:hypothetical protein